MAYRRLLVLLVVISALTLIACSARRGSGETTGVVPATAATPFSHDDVAVDQIERMLDELGQSLDSTDTLTDADDILP